ncbi:lysophospholipid acyltransferase family protein [Nocardioides bigeumensis]|uniref:Lysophospholipid acyltransferase family protein n=1 Tax=Nocardioides bigeumensis TaxID=433657 RepID=A0ABN2Y4W0_9ACTN
MIDEISGDPWRASVPRHETASHPARGRMRVLRAPVAAYTRRRFGVRLHHADRVPRRGPVILAPNHLGWMDGPLLAIHSPRPVHALTKHEMFQGRMDPFLRKAGQIPIDRFNPDPRAIKACLRVLREGGVVGIFPEGARGAGELELFKGGTAYLALVTGAPVIPVFFFGTREPGQDSHSRPSRQSPVDIVYGEHWRVDAQPWPRTKRDVLEASASLRSHMLEQLSHAKELTGRRLPGPLPAGDSERDVARRQATS